MSSRCFFVSCIVFSSLPVNLSSLLSWRKVYAARYSGSQSPESNCSSVNVAVVGKNLLMIASEQSADLVMLFRASLKGADTA